MHPKCKCGCGEETKFFKNRFGLYYKDHKNHDLNNTLKGKINKQRKRTYEDLGLTVEDVKNAWDEYKNLDSSGNKITEKYGCDFRTLKKYMIELNITNSFEFNRVTKLHQYKGSPGNKNAMWKNIDKDELLEIRKYLDSIDKTTVKSIKNLFQLDMSITTIINKLNRAFGVDYVKTKLKNARSSNIELEFLTILKFYYNKNVIHQYKLENKLFDYCLYDKLLIELDGEFWHKENEYNKHKINETIQNDKLKNDIANRNNFELIRISDKDIRKPEIFNKIIKKIEEIIL